MPSNLSALKCAVLLWMPLHAAVIGNNVPVKPLTEARVRAEAPARDRAAWLEYLKRSAAQTAADKAALAAERQGMTDMPPIPRQGFSARAMPLHRGPEFYKSEEARHMGEIVLSFQTPAGGWSKNLAMDAPRAKGQSFATGNAAPTPGKEGDFDQPRDESWHYMGTFDNDATNTELHFLAELSAAWPGREGDGFRAGFLRGVDYELRAQFPNGGWPQVWPLEGGYHDMITFNDDAVTECAELLSRVAAGGRFTSQPDEDEIAFSKAMSERTGRPAPAPQAVVEDYSFVPAATRARAAEAVRKALDIILATQIRVPAPDGKGTVLGVWGQQHDPLTLEPTSARNYEMPSLASGESASVMLYLMELPHPSPAVVRSVDAAAAWFEAHKITGMAFVGGRGTPGGRHLEPSPGAPPLWARYYSLTTGKPIFGDRDKTIHDDVSELSLERRNGYAWYGSGPSRALAAYARWKKSHAG